MKYLQCAYTLLIFAVSGLHFLTRLLAELDITS